MGGRGSTRHGTRSAGPEAESRAGTRVASVASAPARGVDQQGPAGGDARIRLEAVRGFGRRQHPDGLDAGPGPWPGPLEPAAFGAGPATRARAARLDGLGAPQNAPIAAQEELLRV